MPHLFVNVNVLLLQKRWFLHPERKKNVMASPELCSANVSFHDESDGQSAPLLLVSLKRVSEKNTPLELFP